ncbi:hypothetical protein V6N13_086587 [Hibiscus sabdariffa]|uniref:Uncharacterized protein n=1 Tax=Hibiscus sabdariffa TaxID=183260 RepID=A0ABR2FTX6_9ROSI
MVRMDVHEDPNVPAETVEMCLVSPPNEGTGNRLWEKMKYQLVEYHSLPGFLRDNEYILGHYRSEWPMKQILLSIFTIHNETLNVWTHLIGFFIFLSLTIYTAMKVPKVVDLHALQQISDALEKADLHKLQSEILTCFPSLSNMPDLNKLREELKTSIPLMDLVPSLSSWHVLEHLHSCLPELFSAGNFIDAQVLQAMKEPITRWPFFAFLGGAMFCLLASSACHLLSCHSERLTYIMLRLDYCHGLVSLERSVRR